MSEENVNVDVSDSQVESAEDIVNQYTEEETQITPEVKKFKLIVDGQDLELDEENVVKYAQKGAKADKELREVAQARKQLEEALSLLQQDPRQVLEALGLPVNELAKQWVNEEIEKQLMDPKERELLEAKKQLEQYEKEKLTIAEQQKEQEIQKVAQYIEQKITNLTQEALRATGLPVSGTLIKQTAALIQEAFQAGIPIEEIDHNALAQMVKEENLNLLKSLTADVDEEAIVDLFGEELALKINRGYAKKAGNKQQKVVPMQQKKQEPTKKLTYEEVQEQIRQAAGGSFRQL